MTVKEELRRIVDDLPDDIPHEELLVVKRVLELLRYRWSDPVVRALDRVPVEDEPLSWEEEAAVAEARGQYRSGNVLSDDELVKELGL